MRTNESILMHERPSISVVSFRSSYYLAELGLARYAPRQKSIYPSGRMKLSEGGKQAS